MSIGLIIALVIVGILFLIFLYASFIKWYAGRITLWFHFKKLEIDKPMDEYARVLLDEQGLENVEIKKVGFFGSFFYGNTYSVSKKRVNISWFTARRASITNLAAISRLVGLAKLHSEGAKGIRAIEIYRWFNWLPILMVPLIIVGLILDLILQEQIEMYTLIFSAIGLALTLFTFTISMIALKNNKKAYNSSLQIIKDLQILNENEEKKLTQLVSAWKQLATVEALINSFELIYFVLKMILSSIKIFGRK